MQRSNLSRYFPFNSDNEHISLTEYSFTTFVRSNSMGSELPITGLRFG